jgi:23S rRNA pseudouridine1911/1915/1917 synthase
MAILTLQPDWRGRLDAGIAEGSSYSRQQVQKWIQGGHVQVNGIPAKASQRVTGSDTITLDIPETVDVIPVTVGLELIYEDTELMVINKPYGLVVHDGISTETRLTDSLIAYYPAIATVGDANRPGIVHRLDKDTEGLMVIAKTTATLENLKSQFQNRTVEKRYYAMVRGSTPWEVQTLSAPIGKHKSGGKMMVSQEGKPAETEFEVLARFTTKTLIDVKPLTGRTHQIRVHLNFLGFPVLGDPLYHHRSTQYAQGQLLQAYTLGFRHPITGDFMRFTLPQSLRLRNAAKG